MGDEKEEPSLLTEEQENDVEGALRMFGRFKDSTYD